MENNDKKTMESKDKKTGEDDLPLSSNKDDSNVKTVKMSNLSKVTGKDDVEGFISFSGDILYIDMQRESETTQAAFVTFKNSKDAETAILLSGATIGSNAISITLAQNYQLPKDAVLNSDTKSKPKDTTTPTRAEDMVSTMLAKGYILGQDALNKAKTFDEKHSLTSKASATVSSIDNKMGLSEKISVGAAAVNEKVKAMDERFLVSQKAGNAGSAIMNNPIVSTGASWVSNAFGRVAKVAEGVSNMTKEKLEKAEDEKKEAVQKEQKGMVNDFAKFSLDDSPVKDTSVKLVNSVHGKEIDQTNHVKGTDQAKPGDQTKAVDHIKPVDQTNHVKGTDQAKPVDQTKAVDHIKPVEQTNPVNLTDQTKHVNEIKPTSQTKPTDQANHVNSTDQTKAIDQTNPVNSTTQPKTTDEIKPTDQTKPM